MCYNEEFLKLIYVNIVWSFDTVVDFQLGSWIL